MEPEFSPVNWLPEVEVDNSAPRYLMSSQRPRGMLDNAAFPTLTVKIGDMGGGLNPLSEAKVWIVDSDHGFMEHTRERSSCYANSVEGP